MNLRAAALHVETYGDGPPLLLLHGWAMHGGVFAPLLARLAAAHRVHVVDLPGHGHGRDSALPLALEPVVEALLQQLPRAIWVGWSLGGVFGLHAAATRPQALDGVVMLCASPRFVRGDGGDGATPWRYGMSPEIFAEFAHGLRHDYRGTLERFIALEAFGSDDARGELRALREALFARGEPAASVLADGLDLLRSCDLRPSLPRLSVPSLWLAGRRDRVVDPRALQSAAEAAPNARFVRIEHGGHAPFLTHANEVAAHLADFVAEVGGGRAAAGARDADNEVRA